MKKSHRESCSLAVLSLFICRSSHSSFVVVRPNKSEEFVSLCGRENGAAARRDLAITMTYQMKARPRKRDKSKLDSLARKTVFLVQFKTKLMTN